MAEKEERTTKGDTLTEAARTIGATLGNAAVRAGKVLEGVKAAAHASAKTYKATAKRRKKMGAVRPKKQSARQPSKATGRASVGKKRANQEK